MAAAATGGDYESGRDDSMCPRDRVSTVDMTTATEPYKTYHETPETVAVPFKVSSPLGVLCVFIVMALTTETKAMLDATMGSTKRVSDVGTHCTCDCCRKRAETLASFVGADGSVPATPILSIFGVPEIAHTEEVIGVVFPTDELFGMKILSGKSTSSGLPYSHIYMVSGEVNKRSAKLTKFSRLLNSTQVVGRGGLWDDITRIVTENMETDFDAWEAAITTAKSAGVPVEAGWADSIEWMRDVCEKVRTSSMREGVLHALLNGVLRENLAAGGRKQIVCVKFLAFKSVMKAFDIAFNTDDTSGEFNLKAFKGFVTKSVRNAKTYKTKSKAPTLGGAEAAAELLSDMKVSVMTMKQAMEEPDFYGAPLQAVEPTPSPTTSPFADVLGTVKAQRKQKSGGKRSLGSRMAEPPAAPSPMPTTLVDLILALVAGVEFYINVEGSPLASIMQKVEGDKAKEHFKSTCYSVYPHTKLSHKVPGIPKWCKLRGIWLPNNQPTAILILDLGSADWRVRSKDCPIYGTGGVGSWNLTRESAALLGPAVTAVFNSREKSMRIFKKPDATEPLCIGVYASVVNPAAVESKLDRIVEVRRGFTDKVFKIDTRGVRSELPARTVPVVTHSGGGAGGGGSGGAGGCPRCGNFRCIC